MDFEFISIWIGAFITLCCFSFLVKDNPFYRFAESLFVGVSAGYYLSVNYFHQVLKPNLFAKLFPSLFNAGEAANAAPEYMLLIPGILGCLMLLRFSQKLAWVSRFTVAFVMGISTGVVIVTSTQQLLIPQIAKSIKPIIVSGDIWQSFSNFVLVLGTIACLFYFFFSTEHRGRVFGNLSKIGIWFLMISFGASFGATVMGRISLLIGRFSFLLKEWLHLIE